MNRRFLSDRKILFAIVSILTNIGISVGGYSLIFYLVFIPVVLEMNYKKTIIFIFLLMSSPLDLINLFTVNLGHNQHVYLSGISLRDIQWNLVLGSATKPFLNILLLILIAFDFRNASKEII